jgi:hypothetical protein
MSEKIPVVAMAEQSLFDATFNAVSINHSDDRTLQSIEIMVQRGGKTYLLTVETMMNHLQRHGEVERETTIDDQAYVLPGPEILPSDLATLKHMPFEQLSPFLIEQTED